MNSSIYLLERKEFVYVKGHTDDNLYECILKKALKDSKEIVEENLILNLIPVGQSQALPSSGSALAEEAN